MYKSIWTSTGIDSIKTKLLNVLYFVYLNLYMQYLTKVFFSSGIVPDDMKVARITPVHKNWMLDDVNNYRPVSVFPPKLERCI